MPLPLKELVKLNQIIERIQSGRFDANDVDNLLMKLRPYAERNTTLFEVANFVAHSDARNRGLAWESITAFADSMRFYMDYTFEQRSLNIAEPFPSYIYRVFLSKAHFADERKLKAEHKMSRAALMRKIEASFTVDKKTGTCSVRGKLGVELQAALRYVTSFIHARAAFHLSDLHKELMDLMHSQKVVFNQQTWDAQTDRISLAVLCLVSNTEFVLPNGDQASCKLATTADFRILNGHRRLPIGGVSSEPTSFGMLGISGEITATSADKRSAQLSFPLIDTDLDPHEHCDPSLFLAGQHPDGDGDCEIELINFAEDMSLSGDFKLVRTDSLV